ncbi:cysteine desulfurase family protein [Reyranella aquatilis]|jgi:cysteine desulfurase|uniref:Cysteine desulfurase n=1 Tax=Reyranella aquatilis TaxID=2035356 RepID=A0ABS8KPB8_9HYPH|nr:cysteine desulfurase family protein [Reyranella aquatilis]MCC8427889.1 cysteine desulfurase [Reyranella aquatilis]
MSAVAYLDHNATSPLRPAAFDAMVEAMRVGGNPSSVHAAGRKARAIVDKARREVASLVGASPGETVFTSGGTEANNLALLGAGRRRVLVSAVEHDSVRRAAPRAETLPVDGEGVVDLGALEVALAASPEPALVSVMLANNETGVLQPIGEVVRLARAAGALVHCDAVQGAGKVPVDMRELGVDYLSVSAHKLGGPTGVGALIVRKAAPLVPDRRGGGQESNRRAGTENVAGIAGFAAAAQASGRVLDVVEMRDRLELALVQTARDARIYGANAPRLGNTTCISMPGVPAETQVMALDLAGVCISAGAACSSGKVQQSPVLTAMGVPAAEAASAIRVSLGWNSEAGDIERLITAWQSLYIRVTKSDISHTPSRARAA